MDWDSWRSADDTCSYEGRHGKMSPNARWLQYLKGEIEACRASGRFLAADSYTQELRYFASRLIAGFSP